MSKAAKVLLTIKVKRHAYDITEKDRFLDNGSCVQLLTQSKHISSFGGRVAPVLSLDCKKAIGAFEHIEYESRYKDSGCKFFGLKAMTP